jgi:6-phosphogluconolactonase
MTWFRNRRLPAPAARARLRVEGMEDRSVPASLTAPGGVGVANVYTETNNPEPGRNAVLGFHRNPDGSLTRFGSFPTGGTGQLNVPKSIGPDDGDQQVRVTADGKFLLAVNQGSDSVSVFRVRPNGRLVLAGTSASGGDQPVSVGIAGNRVYVANRGDASNTHPGTTAPTVTGFAIGPDGGLTPIPNAAVAFPVGMLATQTLVSPDGRFLFVEVGTLAGTPGGNTVNTFRINPDGSLTAAPGGPASAGTNAPFLLGAAAHPHLNIVYTGFASSSQVGVFAYDETGRTTFVGTAADAGAAPCWCAVSADGRVLYVSNTATDSVGVYSLADPLHPVQIQDLPLGGPRTATAGGPLVANVFEIALDPSGRYLYAITQATDPAFPQGNQLHTLAVAADGTLTERTPPVVFSQTDVPANAHPQRLVAVPAGGRGGNWFTGSHFGNDLDGPAQSHRHR